MTSLPEMDSLPGYELRERLGRGGMSVVFRAWQPSLNRDVALKVLLPELSEDASFIDQFLREARTVGNLQHVHIVPIFDYGVVAPYSYLVMPLLSGGTLVERVLRKPVERALLIDLVEVAQFLVRISDALDYAHQRGIVHCDIKPANILFDQHGMPFLSDFGIASMVSSKTQPFDRMEYLAGSILYLAPELWNGEAPLPSVDQYALALVVYTLLAGVHPFSAEQASPAAVMYGHMHEQPIGLDALRREVSAETAEVVARAMSKKPADRYPTVSLFARAFERSVFKDQGGQFIVDNRSDQDNKSASVPTWALASTRIARHEPVRATRRGLAYQRIPTERVFISYRRADSSISVGRLYERLVKEFGSELIFRDIDSIPLGANFKEYLADVIRGCMVSVVMIGPQWLSMQDDFKRRRLDNPDDFVRVEIEMALMIGIPVIPVLVDGAFMPSTSDLPPSLAPLVFCNGLALRTDPDFVNDTARLISGLRAYVYA